ncbi:hypothetical protein [Nonlabens marinus]|uniref:YD repeat-containing protein n=1 Tax=Nonlabens marinus S1-08 TaxID=1454201 RepID=W8VWI7_9FLAO|nr:hypothetical protein [Nonlabens marinus]BAO56378.1 hypothetical protein NMS_2369 [Nonlabens marinus S1-08]
MNRLIIICLLFFLQSGYGQVKDTLYGKVKELSSYVTFQDSSIQNTKLFSTEGDYGHYGFYSKEFALSRWRSWWYNTYFVHYINLKKSFNENGQLIDESWFYKNGSLVNRYKYVYDDKDRMISELEYSDYNPEEVDILNYGYKANGKLAVVLKTHIYNDYQRISLERLKYDIQDRIIRRDHINSKGEMSSSLIEYDSLKNVRKTFAYAEDRWISSGERSHTLEEYPEGMKFIQFVDSLNENENVVKRISYSERNYDNAVTPEQTSLYTYENGKLIKVVRIDDNDADYINTFKYDDKNRLTEEIRTFNDRDVPIHLNQYQYDESDQVTKLNYYDNGFGKSGPEVIIVDFEITYDDRDNWIEQKKIVNGKHLYTWRRDIEYWD